MQERSRNPLWDIDRDRPGPQRDAATREEVGPCTGVEEAAAVGSDNGQSRAGGSYEPGLQVDAFGAKLGEAAGSDRYTAAAESGGFGHDIDGALGAHQGQNRVDRLADGGETRHGRAVVYRGAVGVDQVHLPADVEHG